MLTEWIGKIERKIYTSFASHNAYKFSSKKLEILLRIFYSVSLALIIHKFSYQVTYPSWLESDFTYWSWPVMWLDYFNRNSQFYLQCFVCLSFVAPCVFFLSDQSD